MDKATNFTASIRSSLAKEFGVDPVGLGGLFMVREAKSKIHVMQDFSITPLESEEDVNNWLHFFEMEPPMLFQSVLVSSDPVYKNMYIESESWQHVY